MNFVMAPLDRANLIKQEADFILQKVRLYEILRPYGKITLTGSYFLDVMVYPDIDIYIPKLTVAQLFRIGARLAESELVVQVVFEKSNDPLMPGGLYLKLRIAYGDWGRPWKIDIWSLDEALIEQKMEPMLRFKARMTDRVRAQIINFKLSIMTSASRTPMYSGYFIYKAIIDEGLTDFQEVTKYLIENGIQVEG
jgi:hypothetical protein